MSTNGVLRLNITAPPARTNVLEATTDFQTWQPVGTNSGTTNGLFFLDDAGWTNFLHRFFRTRGE